MPDISTPEDAPRRDEVAGWVRALRLKPEQKLALMIVFDHAAAHEDGRWKAFVRSRVVAEEAGWTGTTTVRRHLAALESMGLLEREAKHRENGSRAANWLVLNVGALPPAHSSAGGQDWAGTKPLGPTATAGLATTPTTTTPGAAKSRERREEDVERGRPLRLTYKGKPVPEFLASRAVGALAAYEAYSGQRVPAWKLDGSPTPELKRVLGAVVDHPDADLPRWQRVVDVVLANPWWAGPPSVGVVFGPNVVASNLANPGRGGARRETALQRAAREKEQRIVERHERANA